jgi:hypothetical protein
LAEFSFGICYNPGRVNQAADALSRITKVGADESPLDLEVPCLSIGIPIAANSSITVQKAGPTLEEVPLAPLRSTKIISEQSDDSSIDFCRKRGPLLKT